MPADMATGDNAKKPAPETKKPSLASIRKNRNSPKSKLTSPSVLVSAFVALLSIAAYFTQQLWLSHAVGIADRAGLGSFLPKDVLTDARTTEVAEYMAKLYETLADMKYLDPIGIEYGPHEIFIGPRIADKISPEIQQLWSKLPYIDKVEAGQADFVYGSQFADFRTSDDVVRSRDPYLTHQEDYLEWLEKKDEQYVSPYQTPLVNFNRRGLLIMYDVQQHRIWWLDQTGMKTADPALKDVVPDREWNGVAHDFSHVPSRPAGEVLSDIVTWLETLELVPGGGENSNFEGLWNSTAIADLYRQTGWPQWSTSSQPRDFEVALARFYANARAKESAGEPLREVAKYESWASHAGSDLQERKDELTAAKTEDDKWISRWEVFKLEMITEKIADDLKNAQEDVASFCPNDVCYKEVDAIVWEAEQLRTEIATKSAQINSFEKMLVQMQNESIPESERAKPDQIKAQAATLRHAEQDLEILRHAYLEAKKDAARLRPGVTFKDATSMETLERRTIDDEINKAHKALRWTTQQVKQYSAWDGQVGQEFGLPVDEDGNTVLEEGGPQWPKELKGFRERVESEMAQLLRQHAGVKASWERLVKWKEENVLGNHEYAE